MAPMLRLLMLPLLTCIAAGLELKEKTGPFEDTQLEVEEGTTVPYLLHQFQVTNPGITGFRLSGEGRDDLKISADGWLYLDKPLDWSKDNHYILMIQALAGSEVVGEPITVTINVLDINNHAPIFEQNVYIATIREHSRPGVTFLQVSAFDRDNSETPNAQLRYSLGAQIPNKHNTPLFHIDAMTGEISTTDEGARLIKAREGITLRKGDEEHDTEFLMRMFDGYCPVRTISYEENPFFTCMERAETRRRNVDPLKDPDYTLIVRVHDMGGMSQNALMGSATVHIVVEQNLWVSPGPITVRENLKETYPLVIGQVEANEPNAIYTLMQKEREIKFPFSIKANGEILLTEELDREEKGMYILVVMASDTDGDKLEEPMEIHVLVQDENDSEPECSTEDNVFEMQEGESVGSVVGHMVAHDADQEGTLNSQLTYTILSETPPSDAHAFSIDAASGTIQALRSLQRKEHQLYNLMIRVSDPEFSTDCQVIIKIIDVNNELPKFEKLDYGTQDLAEDTAVGHTIVTISATDADDPDSGSSKIEFHISSGNDDEVFRVETDGTGVGHVVIAKALDFESSQSYKLQIDARNPEPLMKGLQYGKESTAFVSLTVIDVDEPPQFDTDISEVSVLENAEANSVLLKVEAEDPEQKEISYKLDGDAQGWLEIDAATGEIKTKGNLDRETLQTFDITITAFEKDHPEMSSQHVVTVNVLDVNDNKPILTTKQAFVCVKTLDPVIVEAKDADSDPFSDPFTFTLEKQGKYPNWKLENIDGKSAKLSLLKAPVKEITFHLPITIKDNADMGVTQEITVRVCNCTELGYCFTAPEPRSLLGMGATVGLLVGVLGFCVIVFIVVIRRVKKQNAKGQMTGGEDAVRMM